MGSSLLTSLLLLGTQTTAPECETIDLVERNYCYDRATGERRFVQLIYWRYHGDVLHVDHWEMDHRGYTINQVPDRPEHPLTMVRSHQGDWTVLRVGRFVETHTFCDPEVEDRRLLPIESRRGLRRCK